MAIGSDALLEHLLLQVAFHSDQGFSIKALSDAFIDFNAKQHVDDEDDENEDDENDLLFSLKPPGSKSNATSQASDPQHLQKLWDWLVENPDIHVKPHNSQDPQPSEEAASGPVDSGPLAPVIAAHADERLFTTDSRVWHALTDHDVDHKRVPKLEFKCLQVIAAAGPQGILQPDVTRLTGQDKRSVPKRTDALSNKGYIFKAMCLGGGIKTSILHLKKLAPGAQSQTYIEVKGHAGKGKKGDTRRMVHYENWYHEAIASLRKNDNIIAYEDMRMEMGIHGLKWETRALHRCIKRLEKSGCIQRLKARLDTHDPPPVRKRAKRRPSSQHDENVNSEDEFIRQPKVRWVRCIRLMREPTDKDKEAFITSASMNEAERVAAEQEDSDADADDDDYVEVDAAALPALSKMTQITQRIPPQWQPSMHHTQFTYHLVESFGTKGLSTMDLADMGMGHFWRRPLDELLARLTDVWTASQPLHLRHLAVVRDTSFLQRVSHYVFRTFENFQKLVDRGEAAWEAIGVDLQEIARKPDLDEWGFPRVKSANMVGLDGIGNIQYCKNTVSRHRNQRNIFEKREMAAVAPGGVLPKRHYYRHAVTRIPGMDDGIGGVTSISVAKQYKKDLWKMHPKRVQAELKEWETRSHKLAVSLARDEFGLNSQGAPKRKSRRTKKAVDVAVDVVPADGNSQSPAQAGPVQDVEAAPAFTPLNQQDTITQTTESPADAESHTIPAQQSVTEHTPQPDTNTSVDVKEKPSSPPGFDKRVSEIEQQILDKANPGIYINPPGSGQMKNNVFQPRGRPSKYMIAVFKSEKLKALPWFQEQKEEIFAHQRPLLSPSPSEDGSLTMDLDDMSEVASVQSSPPATPKPGQAEEPKLIIRNGRRGMLARKRKAPDSLRAKVTKRLAVESSFEQHYLPPLQFMTPEKPVSQASSSLTTPGSTSLQPNTAVPVTFHHSSLGSTDVSPTFPNEVQAAAGATNTDTTMVDASSQGSTLNPSLATSAAIPVQLASQPSESTDHNTVNVSRDKVVEKRAAETPVNASTSVRRNSQQSASASSPAPARSHRAKAATKVGVGRAGGIVTFNREKMILALIAKNNGMFGGDRELFYPFVTAWEKEYHRRPDRHTLDRILGSLVEDGRLKKISFTFKASNGTVATKTIVMEPHIDPESPEIQELKKNIIEYFPVSYLPENTDLAPDLRKHIESDVRNVGTRKPKSMNTMKTFFPEDDSVSVSRVNYPAKIHLGMTEAGLQNRMSQRRRRREEEERRQERYVQAQQDEEIDEAVAALTTDFQLTSYQHDPKRAIVDRGPRGRGRLAKLQRWGAEDHNVPRRALGLLTANHDEQEAARNSMNTVAASDFGVLQMSLVPSIHQVPYQSDDVPLAPAEPPVTLSEIIRDAAGPDVTGTFNVIEALSLTSPYQRFHPQSGTFSTDPMIITTSSQASQYSFGGQQMPMSLADIFKQAGEEATLLKQPDPTVQAGQYEVPTFAIPRLPARPVFAPAAPLRSMSIPTQPPRPSPKPMLEYKAYQQRTIIPRAARSGIFSMTEREEQRLIYAVVAVKALAGGLEQLTNWGLVHQVFHYKFDPNYCRHRWSLIRSKHSGMADKLQSEFQRLFPEAYERGEVPEIDFVEPEKYDWVKVVDWAENVLTRPSFTSTLPFLPKDRKALEDRYEVKGAADVYNVSREDFWVPNITQLRRDELAASWTYIRPLKKERDASSDEDHLMMAKSWVRANVVTPDAVYDSNVAHRRLVRIENDLPKALEQLLGAKIIRMENKGRQIPGRNYDISDQVLQAFKRQWDVKFLREAAAYKATLDEAFTRDGKLTLSYQAKDPEMMVMTNLISRGRAKVIPLLPPTDHTIGAPFPRLTKWGFTEGNYKTVHMDKTRLHFGLELHPTSSYIYGHPITKTPPPLMKQFPGEIGPRLPLWTDINGDLIAVYWDMVVMATLWLLCFRPGLTVQEMSRSAYRGKLWGWELEVFLEWAEGCGVARRVGEGTGADQGWSTGEWWWLAFLEEE